MNYREVAVAKTTELQDGQKKAFKVDDTKLLLVRLDGHYYAMPAECPHYGAPLEEGHLNGHRLICPWHHACFDVRSGRQLEAPGLDSLPLFDVFIRGEDLIVRLPEQIPTTVPPGMTPPAARDDRTFVIAGGGAAAAYAAEGMREAGFAGRILILTPEKEYAYDRPNCSKEYLADEAPEEWMPLRDADFYERHGIEWRMGSTVADISTKKKKITLRDGSKLRYHKLLIATGGLPRQLRLKGADSKNVFLLRSLADSRRLRKAGKAGKRAVIIGASFIGMEGAMSLRKLGMKVDVVAPEDIPFAHLFGRKVGKLIRSAHKKAGIRFHLGHKAESLTTKKGRVTKVTLDNGDILDADLVLVGIGVRPATSFVRGLSMASDGGIIVDSFLHAGRDVYAAGDVACHPYRGRSVRIEHWKVACQQGRIAGRNMAGAGQEYRMEPFFWTAQQGLNLRYVGHAEDFDRIEIDGELDVESPSFIAYYLKDEKVLAALGAGRDLDMAIVQERLRDGKTRWKEVRVKYT